MLIKYIFNIYSKDMSFICNFKTYNSVVEAYMELFLFLQRKLKCNFQFCVVNILFYIFFLK